MDPLYQVLTRVTAEWHDCSGCGATTAAAGAQVVRALQRIRRNRRIVARFLDTLPRLDRDAWDEIGTRWRRAESSGLWREAHGLVDHGARAVLGEWWIHDPVVLQAAEATEVVIAAGGGTQRDAERCDRSPRFDLGDDAFNSTYRSITLCALALLMWGVAHPLLCADLYDPFGTVVPMNELVAFAEGTPDAHHE
jgi:hypothetical protein